MLKKIIMYPVVFAVALLCNPSFATTYDLAPSASMEYKLAVDKPTEFVNHLYWSITATCTFHSEDESDDMVIKMLSHSGKINGNAINKGEMMTITVHNNERMKITADSGAKVELTNKGLHMIKASCST